MYPRTIDLNQSQNFLDFCFLAVISLKILIALLVFCFLFADESTGSPCAWQGVHDPPLNNQVLLLPSQTAPSSPRAAHHVFNRLHNGSNSRRQISLDDTWLSTNHHQQTGNGAGDDSSSAGDDELLVTKQNTSSAPGRNGR